MEDWKKDHKIVIKKFLDFLNKESDNHILKGGTALLMCYNLDRFSEDIDLDGTNKNIENIVSKFCDGSKYSFRVAKNTDTTFRAFINYNNKNKPLKVEVSYRNKNIEKNNYTKINGINVYKINNLCMMKAQAYMGRDKIRDLFDLTFIVNNYGDILTESNISLVKNTVSIKGIEQFDYIIKTQEDNLIDKEKLASDFLNMYDNLDLLYDKNESKIVNDFKNEMEVFK